MIFLSLGTNQGELKKNLQVAREFIEEAGIRIVNASEEVLTKAWGIESQPDFLNQVLRVEFKDSARLLLALCQSVEKKMGKIQPSDEGYIKWGQRIIDIDILEFDGLVVNSIDLTLPHHTVSKDYIARLIQSVS